MAEMTQIKRRYSDQDNYFLFEEHKRDVQIVVFNQGDEPLLNAAITVVMPNHGALYVATQLPRMPKDDRYIARTPAEQADYPAVTLRDDSIQISAKLDDIEPGEPVAAFKIPLRICVGEALKGRRVGLQYSVHAQNLRSPAKGTLRLFF